MKYFGLIFLLLCLGACAYDNFGPRSYAKSTYGSIGQLKNYGGIFSPRYDYDQRGYQGGQYDNGQVWSYGPGGQMYGQAGAVIGNAGANIGAGLGLSAALGLSAGLGAGIAGSLASAIGVGINANLQLNLDAAIRKLDISCIRYYVLYRVYLL